MTRKLATIRKVADIQPIEGADAIERVTVDGWHVVAKKGEFQVGELAVYFEIDSVLPIREEFEFLRKGSYVKKDWLVSNDNETGEGFRLKTIKLRGQVSQGLLLPWKTFYTDLLGYNDIYEGFELTDILGVVKWDPPVPAQLAGKVRGNFPTWIPKTDQERIQNVKQRDLDAHQYDMFEVTMKMDGSSMTVYWKDGRMGVCSRNLDLKWEEDDTTFSRIVKDMGLEKIFQETDTPDGIAIQGELLGPGIQGNQENFKEHKFMVFDIYDSVTDEYLRADQRQEIVDLIQQNQVLDGVKVLMDHVPVLTDTTLVDMTKEEILELANGPSLNAKRREGLVFKSYADPSFSFKAISNEWLLKKGE